MIEGFGQIINEGLLEGLRKNKIHIPLRIEYGVIAMLLIHGY